MSTLELSYLCIGHMTGTHAWPLVFSHLTHPQVANSIPANEEPGLGITLLQVELGAELLYTKKIKGISQWD